MTGYFDPDPKPVPGPLRMRVGLGLAGDFQTAISPFEGNLGAVKIDFGIGALEPIFGPLLRALCALDINFFGALGSFGKNCDFVR
jgi:hypothetical protein